MTLRLCMSFGNIPFFMVSAAPRYRNALVAIAMGTLGGLIMALLFQGEVMTILGNGGIVVRPNTNTKIKRARMPNIASTFIIFIDIETKIVRLLHRPKS